MRGYRFSILVADPDDLVRAGLRTILEIRRKWSVCCEARTGEEAIKLARTFRPDVVVVDVAISNPDGIAVTRQIKQDRPESQILAFTSIDDENTIRSILAAGASAFVPKPSGSGKLIEAIESLSNHKPFFTAQAAETLLKSFLLNDGAAAKSSSLTRRQREIVRLLATGRSNKEVAASLSISIKTVETHRAAIMRKLGFRSVANLVRYAVREGVIKP